MDKNSKLSALALSILFVATVGVGSYIYLNQNKINASADVTTSEVSAGVPLKIGPNYLRTKIDFNQSSKVLKVNGGLISIESAKAKKIISSVTVEKSGKILGKDIQTIPAGADIVVNVLDISTDPVLYLEN